MHDPVWLAAGLAALVAGLSPLLVVIHRHGQRTHEQFMAALARGEDPDINGY